MAKHYLRLEYWFSRQYNQILGENRPEYHRYIIKTFTLCLSRRFRGECFDLFNAFLKDSSRKTLLFNLGMMKKNRTNSLVRNSIHKRFDEIGEIEHLAGVIGDITAESGKRTSLRPRLKRARQHLVIRWTELVQTISSLTIQAQELAASQEHSAIAANAAKQSADDTQVISNLINSNC